MGKGCHLLLEQIDIFLNPVAKAAVLWAHTLRKRAPPVNTVPSAIDYTRPQDSKAFKDARFKGEQQEEKQRQDQEKAAEEFRKRQLQGQLQYLKESEEANEAYLRRISGEWEQAYKDRVVTAEQFLDAMQKNETAFSVSAAEKVARETEIRLKQEQFTSEQVRAIRQQERNEYQKILDDSNARLKQANELRIDQEKKATQDSLQVFEDRLNREIDLQAARNETVKARLA